MPPKKTQPDPVFSSRVSQLELQARHIVDRAEFKSAVEDEDRIRILYLLLFQRSPTPEEVRLGESFIAQWVPIEGEGGSQLQPTDQARKRPRDGAGAAPRRAPKPLSSWAEYAHALLMTSEMSFVR